MKESSTGRCLNEDAVVVWEFLFEVEISWRYILVNACENGYGVRHEVEMVIFMAGGVSISKGAKVFFILIPFLVQSLLQFVEMSVTSSSSGAVVVGLPYGIITIHGVLCSALHLS